MTEHLIQFHKGEDPQSFVKITLLDEANTLQETRRLELIWTRKLFAFKPTGLNAREEDNFDEAPKRTEV